MSKANDSKLHIQILRTTQKDDEIVNDINQNFINVLMKLRINKLNFKQHKRIDGVSKFLYYILTSLSCLQTLGEEYTGLIRVDGTKRFLPSKPVHVLWLILETFGESISHKLLEHLEKQIIENDDLLPDAKQAILATVRFLKKCLPFIVKLQKAEFYFNGQYPDIPKRLTSINYRCVHPIYDEQSSRSLLKILGLLTLINFGINVYTKMNLWKSSTSDDSIIEAHESSTQTNLQIYTKCILCLEPRKNECVTQCGHVFCWKCIGDWCQIRKECPICREVIVPSRIIYLQNYI